MSGHFTKKLKLFITKNPGSAYHICYPFCALLILIFFRKNYNFPFENEIAKRVRIKNSKRIFKKIFVPKFHEPTFKLTLKLYMSEKWGIFHFFIDTKKNLISGKTQSGNITQSLGPIDRNKRAGHVVVAQELHRTGAGGAPFIQSNGLLLLWFPSLLLTSSYTQHNYATLFPVFLHTFNCVLNGRGSGHYFVISLF